MKVSYNKELHRRVDEVLFYVWDPIGVNGEPLARGEYESYVPQVVKLVEANDDIRAISKHLAKIVSSRMGMSPNKKQCDYAAEMLLRHKKAVIERRA
ncbi:MAG: hypothetical protein JSV99_02075 [Planctomycetota bacterium]|nr:MAG: hypothetical protein JSV99_02075 [Planctomycetota bacterium]